jgi:uncharacterized membrane protein HdeD (DUF308 family)
MNALSLLGSTLGLGFAAGLNIYATVLVVGLGVRFGFIHLAPELAALEVLANPYILAIAGFIYLIEFFADKIPWVDSFWDSFHTFIRPIGAAVIGATAIGALDDPVAKTAIMLLSGGVAFSTHTTKAGTRLAVNHSPEPFTNIGLSLFEDILAVAATWLSLTHPTVMLVLVALFLAIFLWACPKIFRLLRLEFTAVRAWLNTHLSPESSHPTARAAGGASANLLVDAMPEKYLDYWQKKFSAEKTAFCLKCVAGKGVKGLRHSIGFLHLIERRRLVFVTRRSFRFRHHQIDLSKLHDPQFKKGFLFDRLFWQAEGKQQTFHFFKHQLQHGQEVLQILQKAKNEQAAADFRLAGTV